MDIELPHISEDKIVRSSEFLSFVINHKQRGLDWKAFGKKFGNYLLSFVNESSFDPTDKKQLEQQLDSILSQTVMVFGAEMFLQQNKQNIWEGFLLQQAIRNEKHSGAEKTATNWFGEGLTEAFTDRWPLIVEL